MTEIVGTARLGQADEGPRQAPAAGRSRDHRPRRPRPRLGRGARRIGCPRGRQRLVVELGSVSEPRAARARARRRLPRSTLRDRISSTQLSDGETVTVRDGSVWRNGTRLADGVELTETVARGRARRSAGACHARRSRRSRTTRCGTSATRVGCSPTGSTSLRSTTRFRDRHAVVVARGPGYKSDLRIVRPYIRNFKPVLVAVDGGADALLEIGLRPDVIVGDFDSVTGRGAPPRAPSCSSTPTRTGGRRARSD